MTREEAIADIRDNIKPVVGGKSLDMAIQALTAISELSKSLKAVNRYDMDEKVLIGFNMAVAIFNECFGEIGALKNEQSEQNVGMCQQNVGKMSEKQTDGDLINRTDLIDYINNWFEKEKYYHPYAQGKTIPTDELMNLIEQMPSSTSVIVSDTKFYDDYKAELDIRKMDGDLISRDFMKKMGATCIAKRGETGELVAILSIDNLPSAEKTDSFITQEDVAGILNTVESALKGTNYEVVGYDNTDGFLKVLIDVK